MNRRAASGILHVITGPPIIPGSDSPTIRQQSGWGYSDIPVGDVLPPVIEARLPFVYRKRRRLRARKRRL